MLLANVHLHTKDRDFLLNLYDRYYGLVYSKIKKLLPNASHPTHEDLVQDVFLKLISSIKKLRSLDSNKLSVYIVYTSKSVAVDFIRKEANKPAADVYGLESILADLIDEQPEASLLQKEQMSEAALALLALSDCDRQLLYFRFVAEQNYKVISDLTGLTENAVRQRIFQARIRARKLLSNLGENKKGNE